MINFNKLDKTFSIVIDKNYRNVGLGGLGFRTWKLLLRFLKSQRYKYLITYALKSNVSAYKLNLYFSYKKRLLKNSLQNFILILKNTKNIYAK